MCVTRLDRERSSKQEAKGMRTLMRLRIVETMALRTQPRARAFNATAVFGQRWGARPKSSASYAAMAARRWARGGMHLPVEPWIGVTEGGGVTGVSEIGDSNGGRGSGEGTNRGPGSSASFSLGGDTNRIQ